ncbi:glycosyltransferase [Spirosoma panaciterrae]|uniref:glycosyltransferase n=1 Tax=Spirosoma panaciterrae TaxID=496058 RepID=UPI0003A90C9F|nr:nucleotide disphospho-sugar-binding domain-containing protein [Spirosoma panaciterrae]
MEYIWYKIGTNERFFYQPYQQKGELEDYVFWSQIDLILQNRQNKKIQLIYASLGTLSAGNAIPATRFLTKLIAAVEGLSTIHLIIADKQLYTNKPENLPTNISVVDWVPQRKLLLHCDLMITHGGTNSILECVQAGIPILAYPLNLDADHPGNTARVVANGWGVQGDLRKENSAEIKQKIVNLLADCPLPRKRKRVVITPIIDWQLNTDLAES